MRKTGRLRPAVAPHSLAVRRFLPGPLRSFLRRSRKNEMNHVKMMLTSRVVLVAMIVSFSAATEAVSQGLAPAPGPEKGGLASLYPGDEGNRTPIRGCCSSTISRTGSVDEIGAPLGQHHAEREHRSGWPTFTPTRRATVDPHRAERPPVHPHQGRGHDVRPVLREVPRRRPATSTTSYTWWPNRTPHAVADKAGPRDAAGRTPKFSTGIEPTGRWGKFPPRASGTSTPTGTR